MKKEELLQHQVTKRKGRGTDKGTYMTGECFKTSEGKTLETDIWADGELLARHFTWKKGWLTYRGSDWTQESLRWLEYGHFHEYPDSYSKAVEQFAGGNDGYGAVYNVMNIEDSIRMEKDQKAAERKASRINKELRTITPPLPRDFRKWIEKNLIVSYPSKVRDGKIICLACGQEIKEREKEPDGSRIRCACGELTTLKVRKKQIKWTKAIQMYQPLSDGRCMERQFRVEYGYNPSQRKMAVLITEDVRGIADYTGKMWDKWYYGCRYGGYGNSQAFWDRKAGYMSCRPLRKSFYLYDRNLDDLGCTPECISTIRVAIGLGVQTDWSRFLQSFNPTMEAVVKSGIKKLATEKAKGREPSLKLSGVGYNLKLHERLGLAKKDLQKVRQINGGYISVQALQERNTLTVKELEILEKYCNDISMESWLRLVRENLPLTHVRTLLEKSGDGKINQHRIRKYVDYLNTAEARGSNIHDEIIYRCKRWEEYHDRYVEERNAELARQQAEQKKKELYKKRGKFAGIKKNYKRNVGIYGWENKDFKFILPKTYEDIIDEGQMQHNCVGASDSYMLKMATDQSFIVFMRKKEDPDKSFYTIEIEKARIVQAYSAYNRKEEWDSVKPVLDQWVGVIRKRLPICPTTI